MLALEELSQHPYIASDPDRYTTAAIGLIKDIDRMTSCQTQILDMHQQRPIDAIIGDDVSARVITLVTSRVLRLAQAGGHLDTIPRTYFMASGRDYGGRSDLTQAEVATWAGNLTKHAGKLACKASLSNVLVITEQVSTGGAVGRIVDAFTANEVHASYIEMAIIFSSMCGAGNERRAVGVEKQHPEPVSHRHPQFDPKAARELRGFVHDYAEIVYSRQFGMDPPTGKLPTPRYTAA